MDFTRISDWLQVHRAWTSADMAGATVYLLDCESFVEGAFAPAVASDGDKPERVARRDTLRNRGSASASAAAVTADPRLPSVPLRAYSKRYLADGSNHVGTAVSDLFALGRSVQDIIDVSCACSARVQLRSSRTPQYLLGARVEPCDS